MPGAGPATVRWTPPLPTVADLARQLRDVVADLPRFVVAPLRRRRHRTWGATPAEVAARMPGDDLLPRAQYRSTRAITVGATPAQVWPWLIQVGVGRAGWYADDLLDNFARPSAWRIVPELQHHEAGQRLGYGPKPSERLSFVVESFEEPHWLLWRGRVRSWSWRLVPLAGGRTRLISRLNAFYDWRRPGVLVTVLLMEFGDYAMMRRMLLGIKERAERGSGGPP
ncbi:MAG TPA: SRPBCC family protein [Actinoplanes sp.]|nr:SRPBCC family protein [Actinoplanes sp.]